MSDSPHTVICTELYRQGYLPASWFAADSAYAHAYIDETTRAVYIAWAKPVVAWMQRSSLITQFVRPFGMAWAQHMAYVMGTSETDSSLGRLINDIGVPLHQAVGKFLVAHHFLEPVAIRQ